MISKTKRTYEPSTFNVNDLDTYGKFMNENISEEKRNTRRQQSLGQNEKAQRVQE
jgi:hypothetical protein